MDIIIKPLTPDLLQDYLYFFDNLTFTEHPHWSVCYCFSYHFTGRKDQWNLEANRSSVVKYINEGKMKGYLAFHDNLPVGWCNANDRLNYERLLKYFDLIDNPSDKVCSIVCFVVKPEFRRKGIAQSMLGQIITDYCGMNYDYIEAYPGKGSLSCEKLYKGPLDLYKRYGFTIQKEFKNYYVVRKRIS